MPAVRIILDEQLLRRIDATARKCGTTRSAFARKALRAAVGNARQAALERKHREGYARKPVKRGEFSDWEAEQVWGDR
jgi:metal-responsive CopG/Arc/MetJ family transcriptional regulator